MLVQQSASANSGAQCDAGFAAISAATAASVAFGSFSSLRKSSSSPMTLVNAIQNFCSSGAAATNSPSDVG